MGLKGFIGVFEPPSSPELILALKKLMLLSAAYRDHSFSDTKLLALK